MKLRTKLAATVGLIAGLGVWRWQTGGWPWRTGHSPRERVNLAIDEVDSLSDHGVFEGGTESRRPAA